MTVDPRATYRLQFRPGFGFAEAAALADYLAALGISHVYASPYLQAAPGSTHGYDVVDPARVNEELGGATGHRTFCDALARAQLGQLLDIVPNHMAIGPHNPWWWDVLENGPSSRYAYFFDVEWSGPEERLRDKVLLPVLREHYGRVVESGEIKIRREGGSFTLHYFDHAVPVAPHSVADLLSRAACRCGSADLAFIADALQFLPPPTATDRESVERLHRDKEVLRRHLARLCSEQRSVAVAIDAIMAEINGNPDAVDSFLSRQNYRLAFWRAASQDLGYRRFFDVSSLVALRTEDTHVFAETHSLVLGWLREGVIDGLRIDHPDGLRDPEGYFWRLRDAQPTAWIVAEKILTGDERLPATWPVDGTVGYEFISQVTRLLMHPDGERPLTDFYMELTGCAADFASVVRDAKDLVLHDLLGSELNRLTALLLRICEQHRGFRDYTRHEVHQALRELLACFPAYRSYARPETGAVTEFDRQCVDTAVEQAKALRPDMDAVLVDFIRDILLLRIRGEAESELACRFQQLSGSVMAKGVEDTAFYNFNRLVALNEVGASPDCFTIGLDEFHRACAHTLKHWPRTLLATSTHDTKRSEDVRARLAVLSEIPDRWTAAVRGWVLHNERHRRDGMPDRNTEYLFYQAMVGAWPVDRERALAYMQKAIREAKTRTSWNAPSAEFEEAVNAFVVDVLADRAFVSELQAFVDLVAEPGRINSLAQVLLKMTAPGVPDIYQGSELWDLSLVDPDNRRHVDFRQREQLLAELTDVTPESVLARTDEGLPKLWVIKQALALRRARPRAFGSEGTYQPIEAEGSRAEHVVAFVRGEEILTLVPRWRLRLGGDWDDTWIEVPAGRWRHLFSGDVFASGQTLIHDLLARFPVCLLARDSEA